MATKRGQGESLTSQRRLTAQLRSARALRHRLAGKTYEEIARLLGYENRGSAYFAVKAALKRGVREPAEELIALTEDRLDRMLNAVWTKALQGDVQAILTVLRIEKQRSDLLGLNAPKEIDITVEARRIAEEEGLDPEQVVKLANDWLRARSGAG